MRSGSSEYLENFFKRNGKKAFSPFMILQQQIGQLNVYALSLLKDKIYNLLSFITSLLTENYITASTNFVYILPIQLHATYFSLVQLTYFAYGMICE
jgi:hypothetical protein